MKRGNVDRARHAEGRRPSTSQGESTEQTPSLLPSPQREQGPANTSISDFQPPGLRENQVPCPSLCCGCYDHHRKHTKAIIDAKGRAPGTPRCDCTGTSPQPPSQITPQGCPEELGNSVPISQLTPQGQWPPPPHSKAKGIKGAQWGADKGRKPRASSGKQRHPSPEMAF